MPSLSNIWTNPQTRVLRDDGETAVIEVMGMVCEWGWARNVKAALAELPNVEAVTHDAGTDTFVVRHTGALEAAAQSVDRRVIVRFARRWLEALTRRVRARRECGR